MSVDKLIVGLTGMPGSGKSLCVEEAQKKGFGIIVMGDIIREETKKRGLKLNPKNIGEVMLDLRHKFGDNIIAEKCIPKMKKLLYKKIIIDGIRSLNELNHFKQNCSNFTLIAIHSSSEIRYKRLNQRGRSDDPKDRKIFQERDMRELNIGLGHVIALAEYIVINDQEKEKTKNKCNEILQRIEDQWIR